jgi:hypothetical protein
LQDFAQVGRLVRGRADVGQQGVDVAAWIRERVRHLGLPSRAAVRRALVMEVITSSGTAMHRPQRGLAACCGGGSSAAAAAAEARGASVALP